MSSSLSQNRLVESRLCFLEETVKQLSKKSVHVEHSVGQFLSKEQYLQECINTLSIKVEGLNKSIENTRQLGISDTTRFGNFNSGRKASLLGKENSFNQQSLHNVMQLFESLQNMTLSNLEKLQNKVSVSYSSIESKSANMQLKFMSMWKEAETLMNTLTYQLQNVNLKIRWIEDRNNRDKLLIESNFHQFEQHINEFINRSNGKFIESIESLHEEMAEKMAKLQTKIESFVSIQEDIKRVNEQFTVQLKKINSQVQQKLQQKCKLLEQAQKSMQQSVNEKNQIVDSKITQLQKENDEVKHKFQQLQQKLKSISDSKLNIKYQHSKQHKNNQIINNNQHSQNEYQRWSQNSIENFISIKKQHSSIDKKRFSPVDKKQSPNGSANLVKKKQIASVKKLQSVTSNKFIPSQQSARLENRFNMRNDMFGAKEQQSRQKEQTQFVRGIAGLRNMKKKEEEKKGSLERNIRKDLDTDINNPLLRHGAMRPMTSLESPSKMKKALPPLASEKTFGRQPQRQPVYYQEDQESSQSEGGEESYFLDDEGYLIDKEGNRLVNEYGEEIQLTYQDLERLKELNQSND